MRRYITFLLLLLGLALMSVVAWAQDSSPQPDGPIIVTDPPQAMITGTGEWQPIQLEPLQSKEGLTRPDIPFSVNEAADECSVATILTIPGGDSTIITDPPALTENASDPILSCMWGGPRQGYRTAWYQFTAPFTGRVRVETFGSNYDTVLGVYEDISPDGTDPCSDFSLYMQTLGCSDDSNGFTSKVTIPVRREKVYYIEVADWDPSAPSSKTLQIIAVMEPFNTNWTQEALMPLARSRHATAVAGNDIYVVGGQKSQLGTVDITNSLERYDTVNDQWHSLQAMPGAGYANTTAVYVEGTTDDVCINGCIYLPTGYSGGSSYDMTHWAYDISGGNWFTRTALAGTPFGWSAAVAVTTPQPGYYVTGGLVGADPLDPTATVRNEMLLYLPALDAWLPRTPMGVNGERYAHTAAFVNNRICVVGGLQNNGVNVILLPDGKCYTPSAGTWADIAPLNVPRYSAGSAVGPDGKWYVFGGVDADSNAVSETEVYDPVSNTWTLLGVGYDLGGTASLPARAWPRGGVVGNRLYAIGGHSTFPDQIPLGLVESMFIHTDSVLLPVVFSDFGGANSPDDHFGAARRLTLNAPQYHDFNTISDYFDVFYFELSALTNVTIKLTQVPSDSNYDIAIYDDNKLLWGEGTNLQGLNESVNLTLNSGRYYVMVERVWPAGDPNTADYRIIVEK